MANVYEAIVKGNKLDWISIPPKEILENKKIKVQVILSDEGGSQLDRGKLMAKALQKLAERNKLKSIKNPTAWQREVRKDRTVRK